MIVFASNLGVLDPSGCTAAELDDAAMKLGVVRVPADVRDLIVRCAGGEVPYTIYDSAGRRRGVGQVWHPGEILEWVEAEPGAVGMLPVMETGGGSWFAVDGEARVWASLVVPDGTDRRELVQLAPSFAAFSASLELDDELLDDMVEFAAEDGFPDRPDDIANLRRHATGR